MARDGVDRIEAHGRRAYRAFGPDGCGVAVVYEAKREDREWNACILLQDGRCFGLRAPAAYSPLKARAFCESLRRMFYAPAEAREQYLAEQCGEIPVGLLQPVAKAAMQPDMSFTVGRCAVANDQPPFMLFGLMQPDPFRLLVVARPETFGGSLEAFGQWVAGQNLPRVPQAVGGAA